MSCGTRSHSQTRWHQVMNWYGCGKKCLCPILRQRSYNCLMVQRKTRRNLSQSSRSACRSLKCSSYKHGSPKLLLQSTLFTTCGMHTVTWSIRGSLQAYKYQLLRILSGTNKNKAKPHNAPKPDDRKLYCYYRVRRVKIHHVEVDREIFLWLV
jgi:hypothetical protein